MMDQRMIAVIDDDADFQGLMDVALRERGYGVIGLPVGEGAVRIITELAVDLVILDIALPGMSGYQVLNHLLTRPETTHLPVLVCTAADWSPEAQARVFAEKGIPVLHKPFDLTRLFDTIEQVLESGALRRVASQRR